MSLSILTIASITSASTSFSGRWSLISCCVRKPRVLPILTRAVNSRRRFSTSASVSRVTSNPNSRINARAFDFGTFTRNGLALASDLSLSVAAAIGAAAAAGSLWTGSATLDNATLGNATSGGTVFAEATLIGSAFGDTALGSTALGNTTFGNTAFGNTAFGNTAFGKTAFSNPTFGTTAFGNPAFTGDDPAAGRLATGEANGAVALPRFAGTGAGATAAARPGLACPAPDFPLVFTAGSTRDVVMAAVAAASGDGTALREGLLVVMQILEGDADTVAGSCGETPGRACGASRKTAKPPKKL